MKKLVMIFLLVVLLLSTATYAVSELKSSPPVMHVMQQ
jgi:hypothetical protein